MKKLIFACVLGAGLCSCSIFQRHNSGDDYEVKDLEPGQIPPSASASVEPEPQAPAVDSEISKLNTKISALETKVDVLSASLERVQAQKSQPVIRAEMPPQTNMAAPVEGGPQADSDAVATETAPHVSAAPIRASSLPGSAKSPAKSTDNSAEKDFRAGMKLFQSGRNLEAASQFAMVAKKYPDHLLAAHALYWAGEASSRGQQWSIAMDNWSELEKKYPHSAYVPEALAGLAKAYEMQGDTAKAKKYRALLARAFPKSPVAMRAENNERAADSSPRGVPVPPSEPVSEEDAPVFTNPSPAAGEPSAETQ